jgi:hypothetical protein
VPPLVDGVVLEPGDGLDDGADELGGVGSGLLVSEGAGAIGGEAAGDRSPGRSPVRLLGDSVQAVAKMIRNVRAPKPLRNLFIATPPGTRVTVTVPREDEQPMCHRLALSRPTASADGVRLAPREPIRQTEDRRA